MTIIERKKKDLKKSYQFCAIKSDSNPSRQLTRSSNIRINPSVMAGMICAAFAPSIRFTSAPTAVTV